MAGCPGSARPRSKALAAKRRAVYVRVGAIEHALAQHEPGRDVGGAGYAAAIAVAAANLELGALVVADGVNPVPESRIGWRTAACAAGAPIVEVELVCGDPEEHRRRVEGRVADIDGFVLPSWASVRSREYLDWTEPRLIVDTALLAPAAAVATIERRIERVAG